MNPGHSFEFFQEIYQWAVKIAKVLEETERENKATNLGKRKIEYDNRELKGGNPKRFNTGGPQNKGQQPIPWQNRTPWNTCGRFYLGQCTIEVMQCYGCGEVGHKMNNCLKVAWN